MPNDTAENSLLLALGNSLAVIAVGAVLGKTSVLDASGRKSCGGLLVNLILPCLVFTALADLDLSNIDWALLGGMALGKVLISAVAIVITLVSNKFSPEGYLRAGIRAMVTTQSNDFALGLPILSALYPMELTKYLYLIAPVTFLVINPVALILLEIGQYRRTHAKAEEKALNAIRGDGDESDTSSVASLGGVAASNGTEVGRSGGSGAGKGGGASATHGNPRQRQLSWKKRNLASSRQSSQLTVSDEEDYDDDDSTSLDVQASAEPTVYSQSRHGGGDREQGSARVVRGTPSVLTDGSGYQGGDEGDLDVSIAAETDGDSDAEAPAKKSSLCLTLFRNLITNPVLIATVLGIVANAGLRGKSLPKGLGEPLTTIGNAFNGIALLSLGANMIANVGQIEGKYLLEAIILISLKCLLMPVLLALFVHFFGSGIVVVKQKTYNTALFAFIYGTIPAAPGVLPWALQYSASISSTSTVLVLGTLVAAPLMFITSKMAAMQLDKTRTNSFIHLAGMDVSYASAIVSGALLLAIVLNKRLKLQQHRHLLQLVLASFGVAVTFTTCDVEVSKLASSSRFTALWYFQYQVRSASIMLALSMYNAIARRPAMQTFLGWPAHLISTLVPAMLIGSVWWIDHGIVTTGTGIQCFYKTCNYPFLHTAVVDSITIAVTVFVVIFLGRRSSQGQSINHDAEEAKGATDDELQPLTQDRLHSLASLQMSDDVDEDDEFDVNLISFAGEEDTTLQPRLRFDDYVTYKQSSLRLLTLLCVAVFVSVVSLTNGIWVQTGGEDTSLYYQIFFLFYVLVAGHPLIIFCIVGTQSVYYTWITNNIKRFVTWTRNSLYSVEDNVPQGSPDNQLALVLTHLGLMRRLSEILPGLARPRKHRFKLYNNVVVGSELVKVLMGEPMIEDLEHAVLVGRALVAMGVLTHVSQEHHFHNAKYFYMFNQVNFDHCRDKLTTAAQSSLLFY
eukprot:m.186201 g.186201  ORF g.186201 m.186201 type:complete len:962 (+) comp14751_c0_seq5:267-3152(+)